MPDDETMGGEKKVRSTPITRVEEASADPAQPRRLFIASEAEGIEEEEFLPSDESCRADAQVGDTAVIDASGTHHVVKKEKSEEEQKEEDQKPKAGLVKGGPNRPATETNLEPSPVPNAKKA
jgi:hypothetical protein